MEAKIAIVLTSGLFMTEVAWQLYKLYRRSHRKANKISNGCRKYLCKDTEDNAKIFEVMFFSKDSSLCRPHLERQETCIKTDCAVKYFR